MSSNTREIISSQELRKIRDEIRETLDEGGFVASSRYCGNCGSPVLDTEKVRLVDEAFRLKKALQQVLFQREQLRSKLSNMRKKIEESMTDGSVIDLSTFLKEDFGTDISDEVNRMRSALAELDEQWWVCDDQDEMRQHVIQIVRRGLGRVS